MIFPFAHSSVHAAPRDSPLMPIFRAQGCKTLTARSAQSTGMRTVCSENSFLIFGGRGKELYFLYPYSGKGFTYPTSTPTSCSFKIIGISRASSGVCVTRYSRTFGPILRIDSITSTI